MTPQWRARSRAWLRANPTCIRCPGKATICDHDPPVRPHDRKGVLRGATQSMCRPCHSANTTHCTANVFVDHHPGAAHALLGQAV
jgi:hypothetical protein